MQLSTGQVLSTGLPGAFTAARERLLAGSLMPFPAPLGCALRPACHLNRPYGRVMAGAHGRLHDRGYRLQESSGAAPSHRHAQVHRPAVRPPPGPDHHLSRLPGEPFPGPSGLSAAVLAGSGVAVAGLPAEWWVLRLLGPGSSRLARRGRWVLPAGYPESRW